MDCATTTKDLFTINGRTFRYSGRIWVAWCTREIRSAHSTIPPGPTSALALDSPIRQLRRRWCVRALGCTLTLLISIHFSITAPETAHRMASNETLAPVLTQLRR